MHVTQKQILAEENGFRYAVAPEEFADAIVCLLSDCFSREPMSAALEFSARDLEPLVARFMPGCTTNNLSVIAVPMNDPDKLAGVFISRDFKSPVPEGIPEDFPWFTPRQSADNGRRGVPSEATGTDSRSALR